MTDYERQVLDHYQLSTACPIEWPAEKDLSDASDEEDTKKQRKGMVRRSKSRYSALERVTNGRTSFVPGSQKTDGGLENLVQRDEPDPLGSADSVVRILRSLGLPVDDTQLRNRFLLSSTTFSPSLFLSQVHSTASTNDLLHGLDVLTQSIDQKSASLKVLVESNFERFVRAKATIDNVYTEMKYRGEAPTATRSGRHSRHASRNSFRSGSGNHTSLAQGPEVTVKKNALIKESDYGVMGIKTPLLEVSAKAEEIWGPALGGREKEDTLKAMSSTVERFKDMYQVNGAITDCIKRKDYETLVEEYAKAKKFADEAKRLSERLGSEPPTDTQIHQILLAARVWHDVEGQIEDFKRDLWKRLTIMASAPKTDNAGGSQQDQHMELISILLELGVKDNPIEIWLGSRYEHLKNKITTTSERSRVEIEVLRRRLAYGEKPTPQVVASHLRSLARHSSEDKPISVDSAEIIELWEKMNSFLTTMLSAQGILGEVTEFWQAVQNFIDGKAGNLPAGLNGESKQHHRLSQEGVSDLKEWTVELVDLIREGIYSFFADPPIEDISSLFSPMPITPKTPKSSGASILSPTSMRDPRFNFDANNLPPPSPKRGEAWEKFAFWPPWSNSLSGVAYLAKLLVLVGTGASEMASISPISRGDPAALEALKTLVGGARERCVTAICAAWNKDAENIKVLEDWRRAPDKRNLTKMPANFGAFESAVLTGMQKILYISEAKASTEIVFPPPAKLLQMVRSQFVTTLYKALSGMVENAEKPVAKAEDDWTTDADGLASPVATVIATSIGAGTVNASDRNVRMLLTLSNLQALRSEIVPNLTMQFENAFSVKLTDESKTIRDVLGQIDARLFQSYTRPSVESIRTIIRTGISSPTWAPRPNSKPQEVRPYVYEVLLALVLVHTQVSTTASSLTPQVLSYLLEQASRELLSSFQARRKYDLASLMQATLDVEFIAQTLSQYTTDKCSEIQSAIYQELDKGTDDAARARLQSELQEMKNVLKRLREGSRSEFACFKKVRRVERPSVGQASSGGAI